MLADVVITQPDYHTPHLGAYLSLLVGVVFIGGPLIVAEVRRGRAHRAVLAGRAERAKAKHDAAVMPVPLAAPVVAEPYVESPAETTRVITVPPRWLRSGRHAAPSLVGSARVPLNMGRRLVSVVRNGWFRA
jgi:hypothetical protein